MRKRDCQRFRETQQRGPRVLGCHLRSSRWPWEGHSAGPVAGCGHSCQPRPADPPG